MTKRLSRDFSRGEHVGFGGGPAAAASRGEHHMGDPLERGREGFRPSDVPGDNLDRRFELRPRGRGIGASTRTGTPFRARS